MNSPLSEFTPEDPVAVLEQWLTEATEKAVQRHPNAMTVATVDDSGQPSARVVLLKALSTEHGFAVFHTHYESRKGVDLDANSRSAAVLHWDRLGRQVRLEGPAVRCPPQESDAYFATRPWRSQLNARVSHQSQTIDDPDELLSRARAEAARHGLPDPFGDPSSDEPDLPSLARPQFWGGYRLWFSAVELWAEGSDRFHDRIRYVRSLEAVDPHTFRAGPWRHERLQP